MALKALDIAPMKPPLDFSAGFGAGAGWVTSAGWTSGVPGGAGGWTGFDFGSKTGVVGAGGAGGGVTGAGWTGAWVLGSTRFVPVGKALLSAAGGVFLSMSFMAFMALDMKLRPPPLGLAGGGAAPGAGAATLGVGTAWVAAGAASMTVTGSEMGAGWIGSGSGM